jgi:hypothetical protein
MIHSSKDSAVRRVPLHCYITHDQFFSETQRLCSIIFRTSGSGIEEGVPLGILQWRRLYATIRMPRTAALGLSGSGGSAKGRGAPLRIVVVEAAPHDCRCAGLTGSVRPLCDIQ